MNRSLSLALIAAVFASATGPGHAQEQAASTPRRVSEQPVVKPAVPRTQAACLARGGEWIFAGPQNVVKYCLLKTPDAGKACGSSAQCQGECVERATGNVCAAWFSGCYAPTGRGTVTECVN